jgi:stearoyl-CoA desaturase (delta-9 desaturase)
MEDAKEPANPERILWLHSIPYIALHVGVAFGLFLIPATADAVALAVGLYFLRMFGITAGYHRYFAHRGFKTGRGFQFVLALLGTLSAQKGVLWWSGLHRHHHKHSDTDQDVHSPRRGFQWSHHGWFLVGTYDATPKKQLEEFAAYPELLWLNRWHLVPPLALAALLFAVGGLPWAFYGMAVSTVALYHGTFTINSLAHVWGSRRYETGDTSRNNFWLALITMGEGWHNNHHRYQSAARNGFFWWELDLSYLLLKALSLVGLVWDLRQPPAWLLEGQSARHARPTTPIPHARSSALPAVDPAPPPRGAGAEALMGPISRKLEARSSAS